MVEYEMVLSSSSSLFSSYSESGLYGWLNNVSVAKLVFPLQYLISKSKRAKSLS